METQPFRVCVRTRPLADDEQSCLEVDGDSVTVHSHVSEDVLNSSGRRDSSARRSSVSGGGGNRKSSLGCSSLIPRTPQHTPRALLRNVLGAFPSTTAGGAGGGDAERFVFPHAVLSADASQADVFDAMLGDVAAACDGQRAAVLCYGAPDAGKSYTLWGTRDDKGCAARAIEWVFAHVPAGTKVVLSFVGLDDNSCLDYLSPAHNNNDNDNKKNNNEAAEISPLEFRDGVDGAPTVARATALTVGDAGAAWAAVAGALARMRSERHQLLTVGVHVPLAEAAGGGVAVGALVLGELCAPLALETQNSFGAKKNKNNNNGDADAGESRNVAALHACVRELVDKRYAGAVGYARSPLTTLLAPALGGAARALLVLCVHASLAQRTATLATLSFGECCSRLKNSPQRRVISGLSASAAAGNAPADVLRALRDVRAYAGALEGDVDALRARCAAWEARVVDGERRAALAAARADEHAATARAEREAESAAACFALRAEQAISGARALCVARLQTRLRMAGMADAVDDALVDGNNDDAARVAQLVARVHELETQLAKQNNSNNNNIDAELRRLRAENESLRQSSRADAAAVAAIADSGGDVDDAALSEGDVRALLARMRGVLARRDAELRDARAEMAMKEGEMGERERELEELWQRCDVLKSQLYTVKLLKASANNGNNNNNGNGNNGAVNGAVNGGHRVHSHASTTAAAPQQRVARDDVAERIKHKAKAMAVAKQQQQQQKQQQHRRAPVVADSYYADAVESPFVYSRGRTGGRRARPAYHHYDDYAADDDDAHASDVDNNNNNDYDDDDFGYEASRARRNKAAARDAAAARKKAAAREAARIEAAREAARARALEAARREAREEALEEARQMQARREAKQRAAQQQQQQKKKQQQQQQRVDAEGDDDDVAVAVVEKPRRKKAAAAPKRVAAVADAHEKQIDDEPKQEQTRAVKKARKNKAAPQPVAAMAAVAAVADSAADGGDGGAHVGAEPNTLIDPLDVALLQTDASVARADGAHVGTHAPVSPAAPAPLASPPRPLARAHESSFFGPTDELLADDSSATSTPANKSDSGKAKKTQPAKNAAEKKKRGSPDENAAGAAAAAAASKKGRTKKLFNPHANKRSAGDHRKSLAATPGSAVPRAREPNSRLSGVADYGSMLTSLLDQNLFALKTPAK